MRWPDDLRPSSIDWWLETNTMTHTSPLSRATQTIELPGARWRASMRFQHLIRAEMTRLSAFINGLRGPAGRMTLWPMQQQSILAGTTEAAVFGARPAARRNVALPYINATMTGQGIATPAGHTILPLVSPSKTVLPAGYFVAVAGELKQVVASEVIRDRVRTTITPPMRQAIPAAGDVLSAMVDRPIATFRLADDGQGRARYQGGGKVGSMTVELVEVF